MKPTAELRWHRSEAHDSWHLQQKWVGMRWKGERPSKWRAVPYSHNEKPEPDAVERYLNATQGS